MAGRKECYPKPLPSPVNLLRICSDLHGMQLHPSDTSKIGNDITYSIAPARTHVRSHGQVCTPGLQPLTCPSALTSLTCTPPPI